MFIDKANRPHPLTKGEPIRAALGSTPATAARCPPGGNAAFVPPYDASLILDTGFAPKVPLVAPAPLTREKGWRASPLWNEKAGFAIRMQPNGVVVGYGLGDAKSGAVIEAAARAVLAQEIRNARGGQYTFTVEASGEAASADEFEKGFLANFTCRLVLFRFRDVHKDPRSGIELASMEFRPTFGKLGTYRLDRFLGSRGAGANFSVGNGLGVSVVVEKRTPGPLSLPKNEPHHAALRIRTVKLQFGAAPRDDDNTVA